MTWNEQSKGNACMIIFIRTPRPVPVPASVPLRVPAARCMYVSPLSVFPSVLFFLCLPFPVWIGMEWNGLNWFASSVLVSYTWIEGRN